MTFRVPSFNEGFLNVYLTTRSIVLCLTLEESFPVNTLYPEPGP